MGYDIAARPTCSSRGLNLLYPSEGLGNMEGHLQFILIDGAEPLVAVVMVTTDQERMVRKVAHMALGQSIDDNGQIYKYRQ